VDARYYAREILKAPTREQRRQQLAAVPFHLREKVRVLVEYRWQTRPRNTRSR